MSQKVFLQHNTQSILHKDLSRGTQTSEYWLLTRRQKLLSVIQPTRSIIWEVGGLESGSPG